MANLLLTLFLFALNPFITYSLSTYYQIIFPNSFNFRNKTSLSNLNNYQLHGETSISEKSITLVPSKNNTYGSLISKEKLNATKFEMQISFKLSHFPNQGSFISFWFIENITEPSINLNSKFDGFGIVVASEPSDLKSSRTSIRVVKTFSNETLKTSISKYFNQDFDANSKEMPNRFCFDFLTNENKRLYMKYDTGSIRVNFDDSKDTAYSHCLTAFMNPYKYGNFKLGVFAFNGRNFIIDKVFEPKETNYDIISNVELFKVVIFNMNREYISNFEYNTEGRPPLVKNVSINVIDIVVADKAKKKIDSMISYLKNMNIKMEKRLKRKKGTHDPSFYENMFKKMEDYTRIMLDEIKNVLKLNGQKEDNKGKELDYLFEQWIALKDKIPDQQDNKFIEEIKGKLDLVEKNIGKLKATQVNITRKNEEMRSEDL